MSLEKQVMQEMKTAMKTKNQAKLRTLRAIKSAILLVKTEKAGVDELSEEQEFKLLQKLAKQRRDSIAIYEKEGRDDLATTEKEELEVIEEFLPAMMTKEEISSKVKELITSIGASGMQDMGKVMGAASKTFSGKADMSIVSQEVRAALS